MNKYITALDYADKTLFVLSGTGSCDWNWTRAHKHLLHKRTLNHLDKLASLAKWLGVRLWTK